jgi:hypothetical protein
LQFDRQFTVWLIPKVCTLSRSFSTSSGRRITLFQEDVEKIFGIPSGGKNVWDASLDKSQPMRDKITCMLGMEDGDGSPMCAAVKVLRELAGRNLTDEQEDIFKVAFVVFVVCMLVDGNNPGECESVNLWPALTPTDHIHTFNWANYLLDLVFSACSASRIALRKNSPYNPPAGTALFLQVCLKLTLFLYYAIESI